MCAPIKMRDSLFDYDQQLHHFSQAIFFTFSVSSVFFQEEVFKLSSFLQNIYYVYIVVHQVPCFFQSLAGTGYFFGDKHARKHLTRQQRKNIL